MDINQALLDAVVEQRNEALNTLAITKADLARTRATVERLRAELDGRSEHAGSDPAEPPLAANA